LELVFRGFKTCRGKGTQKAKTVRVVAPMMVVIAHYSTVITSMQ